MDSAGRLVKIYDAEHNFLGNGHLLSMGDDIIKVMGSSLPIIDAGTEIFLEIYNEFSGISPYFCEVRLASKNQLNAFILKAEQVFERRKSLKVRTDLSFYVSHLYRDGKELIKSVPNMKIHILNLSMGGMLISSNYNLIENDVLSFYFHYGKGLVIPLKATVIRIDSMHDTGTKELSFANYGCKFEELHPIYEEVVIRYLYERQHQLYKGK